jgi:hypothetical protein
VFNNWCSACHSRGPQNAPGTASLQNKYQGSLPAALQIAVISRGSREFFVRNGVAMMAPSANRGQRRPTSMRLRRT